MFFFVFFQFFCVLKGLRLRKAHERGIGQEEESHVAHLDAGKSTCHSCIRSILKEEARSTGGIDTRDVLFLLLLFFFLFFRDVRIHAMYTVQAVVVRRRL